MNKKLLLFSLLIISISLLSCSTITNSEIMPSTEEEVVVPPQNNEVETPAQNNEEETSTQNNEEETPTQNNYEDISLPLRLLIYYGWPSYINNSGGSTSLAITQFSSYAIVILGSGLESAEHGDHLNTKEIITAQSLSTTKFFGYVDLGITTNDYSLEQIYSKIDTWKNMGVAGIFFDDFGYDFQVSRERQNQAVNYAHDQSLVVIANAWDPDDVFSNDIDLTYNSSGLDNTLNNDDYYLFESFQIKEGAYDSTENFTTKLNKIIRYKEDFGIQIMTITTNDSNNEFNQDKFNYAYYAALIFELTAFGWGDYNFSAADSLAPYRERPSIDVGSYYESDVLNNNNEYYRDTENGQIKINLDNHDYSFSLK